VSLDTADAVIDALPCCGYPLLSVGDQDEYARRVPVKPIAGQAFQIPWTDDKLAASGEVPRTWSGADYRDPSSNLG
jgi:hypothetical protein